MVTYATPQLVSHMTPGFSRRLPHVPIDAPLSQHTEHLLLSSSALEQQAGAALSDSGWMRR